MKPISLLAYLFVAFAHVHNVLATNHFFGITISSFTSSGGCRSAAQWVTAVANAKSQGFGRFRIYGNDCGTTFDHATNAAKSNGVKVMIGIFANSGTIAASASQIDTDVGAFLSAVNKYGSQYVDSLTIGNEVADTPQNIMNKVWDVRGYLNNVKNYHGPISTVHTWVEVVNNPVLCDADRVTVNAHAFYDKNTAAANSGNFILNTVVPALKKACAPYASVNHMVITESGWPSRGSSNGAGVPSTKNEQSAISSLNCASRSVNIMAFEIDDSVWKNANDNEKSFGIIGKSGMSLSTALSAC